MAISDWIKMRTNIGLDPAVILIATRIERDPDEVVGKLHRVWSWATDHLTDGNAKGVTESFLDRYIGVTGFAHAMVEAGWLSVSESGISFPKWDAHMSAGAKNRAETRKRVDQHRENVKRKCNAKSVTASLSNSSSLSLSSSSSPEGDARGRKSAFGIEAAKAIELPPALAPVAGLFHDWLAQRFDGPKAKHPTRRAVELAIGQLSEWGEAKAASGLRAAIVGRWQGLHEPDAPRGNVVAYTNGQAKPRKTSRQLLGYDP